MVVCGDDGEDGWAFAAWVMYATRLATKRAEVETGRFLEIVSRQVEVGMDMRVEV